MGWGGSARRSASEMVRVGWRARNGILEKVKIDVWKRGEKLEADQRRSASRVSAGSDRWAGGGERTRGVT